MQWPSTSYTQPCIAHRIPPSSTLTYSSARRPASPVPPAPASHSALSIAFLAPLLHVPQVGIAAVCAIGPRRMLAPRDVLERMNAFAHPRVLDAVVKDQERQLVNHSLRDLA